MYVDYLQQHSANPLLELRHQNRCNVLKSINDKNVFKSKMRVCVVSLSYKYLFFLTDLRNENDKFIISIFVCVCISLYSLDAHKSTLRATITSLAVLCW